MTERVTVTGGAGVVGSRLAEGVRQGVADVPRPRLDAVRREPERRLVA